MGHCGHKNCPGLGVLDRVYTTRGSKVMKKKATEKKIDEATLRAAVVEAFGPDASDSDIGSVAADLAALALASAPSSLKPTRKSKRRPPPLTVPKSPEGRDQGGRQGRRTRRVRKSSKHRKRRHSTRRRRSGRKSRRR